MYHLSNQADIELRGGSEEGLIALARESTQGILEPVDLSLVSSCEFAGLRYAVGTPHEAVIARWFAVDADRIVVVEPDRRVAALIEEHPAVRVSFSDRRTSVGSDEVPATAHPLDAVDHARVSELLDRKYGMHRRAFRMFYWVTRRLGSSWESRDHFFEIRPGQPAGPDSLRSPHDGHG